MAIKSRAGYPEEAALDLLLQFYGVFHLAQAVGFQTILWRAQKDGHAYIYAAWIGRILEVLPFCGSDFDLHEVRNFYLFFHSLS